LFVSSSSLKSTLFSFYKGLFIFILHIFIIYARKIVRDYWWRITCKPLIIRGYWPLTAWHVNLHGGIA